MSDTPLVSIIMPTYNSADFVEESITSIMNQSFTDWELIVVDDASQDQTVALLHSLAAADPRLQVLVNDTNQGAAVTRNRAIESARGRYIAFLDSDDLWLPEKLTKQLHFMTKGHLAFSHTNYLIVDEAGAEIGKQTDTPSVMNYPDLLAHKGTVGCLTVMFDTEQCGKPLMPLIRRRQDYALWLKILKQGVQAHKMQEALSLYRIRPESISRNKMRAAYFVWRVYRDVEKLPLLPSCFYFSRYAYYHVAKRLPVVRRFYRQ